MARSKSKRAEALTPALLLRLTRALRANPNLTDAADSCGVHPRTLREWIQRGLYPNADRLHAALATCARRQRALVRCEMFGLLRKAAKDDAKWAAYCLELLTEDGEESWQATVPGAAEAPAMRQHLLRNPPPELLADIHAAGLKLVALSPEERQLPAPVTDGELCDPEE